MDAKQSLTQLVQLGKYIKQEGFKFDYFRDACVLFWQIMLDDKIEFGPKNIEFIDKNSLLRRIMDRGQMYAERLRSLLPESARMTVSNESIASHDVAVTGAKIAEGKVSPVFEWGLYNKNNDICYIVDNLEQEGRWTKSMRESKIAAHQMAHRYIHKKRVEARVSPAFPPEHIENRFAKRVEACFAKYVFPTAKETHPRVDKDKKDLKRLLADALDIKIAQDYATKLSQYSTRALAPQTLH